MTRETDFSGRNRNNERDNTYRSRSLPFCLGACHYASFNSPLRPVRHRRYARRTQDAYNDYAAGRGNCALARLSRLGAARRFGSADSSLHGSRRDFSFSCGVLGRYGIGEPFSPFLYPPLRGCRRICNVAASRTVETHMPYLDCRDNERLQSHRRSERAVSFALYDGFSMPRISGRSVQLSPVVFFVRRYSALELSQSADVPR